MKHRRRARGLPALEWTEDLSGGCARVTAVGGRSLRVENHTGVLELSETRVVLNTRRGPLCAEGRDLTLCDIRPGTLVIRGDIRRVDLPCKGGASSDEA